MTDPNTGEEEAVDTIPDTTVFSEHRDPIGSMMEVMEIAKSHIMPEFGKLMFSAADEINRFQVEIADPAAIPVGNPPSSQEWYLEKIDPEPHLRRIGRVEITGAAKIIRTPIVPMREGKLQDTSYAWTETTFDGSKTVIVRTKGTDDKVTICSL